MLKSCAIPKVDDKLISCEGDVLTLHGLIFFDHFFLNFVYDG